MNPTAIPVDSAAADARAALLSALADGEVDTAQEGCALWRDDAAARATWHAYHLIGDVLRSDELATAPDHDAAFLLALRARLAAEPVVLAPSPTAARRRHAWLAPGAVAAGFMAVAGVVVVTRLSEPVASGLVADNAPATVPGRAAGAAPQALQARYEHDPRLDYYLRLHRQALGGVPAAVPGGLPRNIEMLAPITPVSATQAR